MKIIKYILQIIIGVFLIVIISQLKFTHIFNITNYSNYFSQTDIESQEDWEEFYKGESYYLGEDVFTITIDDNYKNNQTIYTVYATDTTRMRLKKRGYDEGILKEILGSKLELKYRPIKEAYQDKNFSIRQEIFTLADTKIVKKANEEKIKRNKELMGEEVELKDSELWNVIEEESYSNYKTKLVLCFLLYFVITIYLSICSCHFEKKDIFVKISSGYPIIRFYLISFLRDFFISIGGFSTLLYIGRDYYCLGEIKNLLILFAILLFFSLAIIYMSILAINHKTMNTRINKSGLVSSASMGIRVFCSLAMILTASIAIVNYHNLIPKLQMEDFLAQYKNYRQVCITSSSYSPYTQLDYGDMFYQKYKDKFDIKMAYNDGYVLFLNDNSKKELLNMLPELKNIKFENGLTIIYPQNSSSKKSVEKFYNDMKDIYNFYFDISEDEAVYYISYEKKLKTYSLKDFNVNLEKLNNPIIFFYNEEIISEDKGIPRGELLEDGDYFPGMNRDYGYLEFFMTKASDQEIADAIKDFPDNPKFKVYDTYYVYEQLIRNDKSVFIGNLMLCAVIFFLNLITTSLVLKIEFDTHALEIAITKVNGMPMLSRYLGIFLSGLLPVIFATILAEFIIMGSGSSFNFELVIFGLILIVLDGVYLVYHIAKKETMSIQKILKGGCL